jgi:hypothetical protein
LSQCNDLKCYNKFLAIWKALWIISNLQQKMERNSTPSKQKKKGKRRGGGGKDLTMPAILRKTTSKQKILWVFSSLHVCVTLFLQVQSQIKRDYFQLQMLDSSHRSNGGLF